MQEANRWRGFGLLETLVVSLILVILASTAAPAWTNWLQQRRVLGASQELISDLYYLQSEAVKRNTNLRISFTHNLGGSCYTLHSGSSGSCSCSEQGVSHCSAPAEAIKTAFLPVGENVRFESNTASLLYSASFGTMTPTGTIRIRSTDGFTLRHRVNLMGRVRACSEGGARHGHPAC